MKSITTPIISAKFIETAGKTAIETVHGTVWANGNVTSSKALLVNMVINEIGDTFVAAKDSKTMKEGTSEPIFKAGETVTRQKQSLEFKALTGESQAVAFAQGASAYGLNLQVVMQ